MEEEYLTVAKIVKPQGIRGELKVVTMTDSPQDLQSFARVYVGGNPYKLLKVRPQPADCAFITLSGVADRNAAELLRGYDVLVLRGDAPALPENTYYIADVIGCEIITESGEKIGVVEEIMPAKTDVYEIAKADGKKTSFAATRGVIISVDTDKKIITVNAEKFAQVVVD